MKTSLRTLFAVALYISLQSCQKSESPQLTVTDLGAFTCDSTEEYHSRLCPSAIEVRLGDQIDTIIRMGRYGESINHTIIEANGNRYLFTDNTYRYHYGFTTRHFKLYNLSQKDFMRVVFHQRIILYQEVPRESNGSYTHHVNKNTVDVTIKDSVRLDINRYTLICPESEPICDTIHRIYEYIDVAL